MHRRIHIPDVLAQRWTRSCVPRSVLVRAYAYERPQGVRLQVQGSVLQMQNHTNLLARLNELFSAKTLTHAKFLKIFTTKPVIILLPIQSCHRLWAMIVYICFV